MKPAERLAALAVTLPPAPQAIGAYVPSLVLGRQLLTSGHLPLQTDGSLIRGKVGAELDLAAGKAAARQAGLAILATVIAAVGSVDRVARVVKVLGLVNSTPDFLSHPAVVNGASELFAAVWGPDAGVGVRSSVGVGSLPEGVPVEIEVVFELG
ncbi:MAG: RidA family protein [Planctomycetia bacterium]|nr:RidA family protein [Planctomycetia bacterium]